MGFQVGRGVNLLIMQRYWNRSDLLTKQDRSVNLFTSIKLLICTLHIEWEHDIGEIGLLVCILSFDIVELDRTTSTHIYYYNAETATVFI